MHWAQLLSASTVFFLFLLFFQKTFLIQEKNTVSWNNSSLIIFCFPDVFSGLLCGDFQLCVFMEGGVKNLTKIIFINHSIWKKWKFVYTSMSFLSPSLLLIWHFVKMFLQLPRIADFMQHSC